MFCIVDLCINYPVIKLTIVLYLESGIICSPLNYSSLPKQLLYEMLWHNCQQPCCVFRWYKVLFLVQRLFLIVFLSHFIQMLEYLETGHRYFKFILEENSVPVFRFYCKDGGRLLVPSYQVHSVTSQRSTI
jgi:hypothetical protein